MKFLYALLLIAAASAIMIFIMEVECAKDAPAEVEQVIVKQIDGVGLCTLSVQQ